MKKLAAKTLLTVGSVAAVSASLFSCGGGASSTTSADTSVGKTAILEVSIPELANKVTGQILADDAQKYRVVIEQYSSDSNGVICDYKNYSSPTCAYNEDSVTLTPSSPTAKIGLYPGLTKICIYQNENYSPLLCSLAELQTGTNNFTFTLTRGTWSLPTGKDINGYTKFAIKGYNDNYYVYGDQNPLLSIIGSKDGSTWNSQDIVNGAYTQRDYQNGGKFFGLGSGGDGFVAIDGTYDSTNNKIVLRDISTKGIYKDITYARIVKMESIEEAQIFDNTGSNVTGTVFGNCKFSSTDGKSITGCLLKNAMDGTDQDYTYKIALTHKLTGPSICYDMRDLYDPNSGVCFDSANYTYNNGSYTYTCFKDGYQYNSSTGRCEADLKTVCETTRGGTYDATSKTCTESNTLYVKVGSMEKVTLTGSSSLPSTGTITVQKTK
ncbi:MAG: hypothetical protein N2Z81_07360 [Hydrogenothermaceae bacterium]|nr:hypothetical protein [Hydrogenothermaceae bacterium]